MASDMDRMNREYITLPSGDHYWIEERRCCVDERELSSSNDATEGANLARGARADNRSVEMEEGRGTGK